MKKPIIDDKYHILNAKGEKEITLQKICDIMEVQVPDKFNTIKNNIENNVATRLDQTIEGCFYFRLSNINSSSNTITKWLPKALKKGASVIFVEKKQYYNERLDQTDFPIIPVDNIIEKAGQFFSYIKDLNGVKTVAVTGTCGKTTTMKFLEHIVPQSFNTYMNEGNANSYMSVANHIMNELTPDKDVYIQETGAAAVDSVKKCATMLSVDAFILLNVFKHHINEYKTQDNILKDKASFDDYMKDDGAVIANFDDEKISVYNFKHQIISFGIETNEPVDYRAVNIVQNQDKLEMDVLHEGKTTHLSISILGMQNAYNALAAFVLCRWLGISETKIVSGFSKYRSKGFRQNFRKVGSYDLLLDCYNVCEDSLKADLDTVRKMKIPKGNKRIAVISGENRLGKDAESISYNMGKNLCLKGIDYIVCVGVADETPENINFYCHGRALYEGIKASGYEKIIYVTNPYDMEKEIRRVMSQGDLILFKGMYNLDLIPVIDKIFGTSMAMNNPYYIKRAKKIENKMFEALKFKVLDALDIIDFKNESETDIIIPDEIGGVPVHRIKPELFKKNFRIRTVDLGKSVVNIGRNAFALCIKLKKIRIPSNVKIISAGAFRYCLGLKEVIIEDGVTHIEENAFRGCIRLKKVYIPESVKYIDETAFGRCPIVKIINNKRKADDTNER